MSIEYLQFNKLNFNTTTFGAILITAPFIVKNTLSQFSIDNSFVNIGCLLMFGLGWIITGYSLSMDDEGKINLGENKTLLIYACSALIAISGLLLHKYIKLPIVGEFDTYIKGVFMAGWILLAYVSGLGQHAKKLTLNILGAATILVSVVKLMPWQKQNNIMNGPSMALIVLGWLSIISGNSLEVRE